jgi:hypothetical protein
MEQLYQYFFSFLTPDGLFELMEVLESNLLSWTQDRLEFGKIHIGYTLAACFNEFSCGCGSGMCSSAMTARARSKAVLTQPMERSKFRSKPAVRCVPHQPQAY